MYGMDPALQHSWMNMLLEGDAQDKLDAYEQYNMTSFFGDVEGVFVSRGLVSNWESVLDTLVNTSILPHFGPGKV